MQSLALTALLATLVAAAPYPPEVAIKPAVLAPEAFFGNKHGNFMPGTPTTTVSTPTVKGRSTGEVVTGGAAISSINNNDGIGAGSDSYTLYTGNGGTNAGWPAESQWVSFVDMFNNNKAIMFSSCDQYNQADDSGPEVGAIYDSIQQVATETQLDHRFILAIMIQESGGCVRVPTSNYGVRNPGLMQDHDGDGTCNSDYTGQVQNPCPTGVITQMIREGAAGTNSGDGLAALVNQAESTYNIHAARAFYIASRLYNSGSVASSGNLEDGIATHCYASDIANRLTGWVSAPHGCNLDG